jgi:hypothetical protein
MHHSKSSKKIKSRTLFISDVKATIGGLFKGFREGLDLAVKSS